MREFDVMIWLNAYQNCRLSREVPGDCCHPNQHCWYPTDPIWLCDDRESIYIANIRAKQFYNNKNITIIPPINKTMRISSSKKIIKQIKENHKRSAIEINPLTHNRRVAEPDQATDGDIRGPIESPLLSLRVNCFPIIGDFQC